MAEITPEKPPLMDNIPSTSELDQVLAEMDPELNKTLESLENVPAATDVTIESVKINLDDGELIEEKKFSLKGWIAAKKVDFKTWLARIRTQMWLFLKTAPKELAIASLVFLKKAIKALADATAVVFKAIFGLSRIQKLAGLIVLGMTVALLMVVKANLKGMWLPLLNDPMLTSFEPRADSIITFDPKAKMISFARAFPQDPELFLFDKLKVNLRPSSGHPIPMGGFEIFAQVDSHETAVELQTRQVELHDDIQRVFEGQQYDELVSDLGKNRLKGLLKTEINHALTQGWVVDIHFKSFVLKP